MKTKSIVETGLFTALICVFSAVSLPTATVPFSLSLIGIFLAGALLPPTEAFLSCLCYMLLGAVGLPVFAGFRGGVQVLVGYTGGFLLSYPLMALTVSLAVKYLKGKTVIRMAVGMAAALVICYVCGCLMYRAVAGCTVYAAVATCVLPYVVFDIIKIVVSSAFALAVEKAKKK